MYNIYRDFGETFLKEIINWIANNLEPNQVFEEKHLIKCVADMMGKEEQSAEYYAGYNSYLQGTEKCPYKSDTKEWKDWHIGWEDAEQVAECETNKRLGCGGERRIRSDGKPEDDGEWWVV